MHYYHSGSKRRLSADEVREKDEETQIDIMREWFDHHFEDLSERMFYTEVDYLYMNESHYDPYEALGAEFDGIVSEDVIHILVEKLKQTQSYWTPTLDGNYSDDAGDYPFGQFDESMKNINTLLSIKLHNTSSVVVSSMHRLLYANIIIAIEVYLSDTFKNEIKCNNSAIRRFVETTSVFKEQKIPISAIYNNMDSIKNRVNGYLTKFFWHRLDKTKQMYENTFSIKFPESMKTINKAIRLRHDIIHRNGKTKNGEYHKINETDVKDLIDEATKFVSYIGDEMNNKSSNGDNKEIKDPNINLDLD